MRPEWLLALVVTAAACSSSSSSSPPDAAAGDLARPCPSFDVAAYGTPGQLGRATFDFQFFSIGDLTRPIAAGGAEVVLAVAIAPGAARLASIVSSDPSVLAVTVAPWEPDSCVQLVNLSIVSGQPGSADLVLLDAQGSEIDRATLTVAAVAALKIDAAWTDSGPPRVLAGSVQRIDAIPLGSNGTALRGAGIVKYTLSSSLTVVTDPKAGQMPEALDLSGEPRHGLLFLAAAGLATIQVDSGTAHAQAALEAVDPGGIDSLSLAQAGADCWYGQEIAVAATVAGQPILGAECGWTIVPPAASAIWDAGGFVGESAPRWTPKTGHQ